MIRRTRKEIIEYYSKDLEKQGLLFPELGTPKKIIYSFNKEVNDVLSETIAMIKSLNMDLS